MFTMRPIIITFVAIAVTAHAQLRAILELDDGISPRYYLGSPPQLVKRQSGGACPSADSHSCKSAKSVNLNITDIWMS